MSFRAEPPRFLVFRADAERLRPDETVNLQDGKWEDIHVTTGALKMYFRELPEPLFTYALFHDFVGAISESGTFETCPRF